MRTEHDHVKPEDRKRRAPFTDREVEAMRLLRDLGGLTAREIAEQYGTTLQHVWHLMRKWEERRGLVQ